MFEYKMPQEIKTKFTKDFMTDFLTEAAQVFNLSVPTLYDGILFHLEGTCGWADAFKKSCLKHGMKDVFTYYENLDWYDSDLFDDEFASLLIEYELIKTNKDLE